MQIWHITQTTHGGSGQYALRLSNALNELGHKSTVWVKNNEPLLGVRQLSEHTNLLQKSYNKVSRSFLNRVATEPYHSGTRLDQWIINQEEKPDIVHLHGLTGWIGFSCLRKLIPKNTPVFWTAHDLWMLSGGCVVYNNCDRYQTGCQSCPSLKQPFSRWSNLEFKYKLKFIQDYNVIPIANSHWMADCIRKSPLFPNAKDIAIVPPIVSSNFFEQSHLSSLREELSIAPDRLVIGLGARTVSDSYKGIPEFIKHFSQSSNFCDRTTLLIFGDGKLETPSNLDCRFLGRLSDPQQVRRFFHSCNVFISPSRMETFGMTLLESQASGTPVVAFRVGGTPDSVCHLKHGWLAEANQFESLLLGLKWILENLEQGNPLGYNATTWVKANFLPQTIAKKQLDYYFQAF